LKGTCGSLAGRTFDANQPGNYAFKSVVVIRRGGRGVGAVTQMLAELVGPSGHVTGIDVSGAQLDQARQHWRVSPYGLAIMTSVALTTAVTESPSFSFISSALRFVMTDSITPPATLIVTCASTPPYWISSIVPWR
jgi:hypothetical protein